MLCWNVNGWTVNNSDLRKSILESCGGDVLCLVETHKPPNNDSIDFQGYTYYGNCKKLVHTRAKKNSGGVGDFD